MLTERFEYDGLVLVLEAAGRSVTMRWEGASDAQDPSIWLSKTLALIGPRLARRNVTVDLRQLTFMNSASVAPLVSFLKGLDGAQSNVVVLFDSSRAWQRTHVQCMRAIARTLRSVRIESLASNEVSASTTGLVVPV